MQTQNLARRKFDVGIVGAGGSGMRASLQLALAGLNVAVLSKVFPTRSHTVAVEDTLDLAFFDDLSDECRRASVACLMPRMHGDICDLRKIKDAEEIELMRHAQATTDAAFDHICGFIKPGLTEQQIRAELEN